MDDLQRVIRDYVVKEYLEEGDDREITDTTPLITGGIVDSFSMVSLKRFLEKKYDIKIPDADATPAAFDTVSASRSWCRASAGVARNGVTRVRGAARPRRRRTPWPLPVAVSQQHLAADARSLPARARERPRGGPAQGGALHPQPAGGGNRGGVPAGAAPRTSSTCARTTTSASRATPRSIAAAHEGLDARGYGMSSVRFICGTQDIHRELEQRLTAFLGTEDTLLFPSCMDANAGVFEALFDEQDVLIADRLVHASIVDGMRLCKAMQDTFKHSDMAHLEEKLQEHQDRRFRVVVTDGVFSMDGDLARLDEIVALAERYGALVFVDDSHATGFMGKTGRGTHEQKGVLGRIDLITTTLGKALGGASGGCVSGRAELVAMCRQRARPYLFSNTVPPVIVVGGPEGARSDRTHDRAARHARAQHALLAAAAHRGRVRHQGRREPDRARDALQREARAGRRARPLRRGHLRRRLLLPGRGQGPGAHPDAALGRARDAPSRRRDRGVRKVGRKYDILGKDRKAIIDAYGL